MGVRSSKIGAILRAFIEDSMLAKLDWRRAFAGVRRRVRESHCGRMVRVAVAMMSGWVLQPGRKMEEVVVECERHEVCPASELPQTECGPKIPCCVGKGFIYLNMSC